MNTRIKQSLIFIFSISLIVGGVLAAIPNNTLRNNWLVITGVNVTGSYQIDGNDIITGAGVADFTSVDADQYSLAIVNVTDILAYPYSSASYIISTDGTNYYAKNGTTGQIDYSGTNATTVIQNAVNNGNKIYISSGVYIISQAIHPINNTELIGSGWDTIFFLANNANPTWNIIETTAPYPNWFRVSNIYFDLNSANNVPVDHTHGAAIDWSYSAVTIEKIYVTNPDYRGVFAYWSKGCYITENYIEGYQDCIDVDYGGATISAASLNSFISNNILTGVSVSSDNGIVIDGAHGYSFYGVIENNVINNCYNGIKINSKNTKGFIVKNNIIKGSSYPIRLLGSENVADSNTIELGSRGIEVRGDWNRVTNNMVINSANGPPLDIIGNWNTVSGNTVSGGNYHASISGNYSVFVNNHLLNIYTASRYLDISGSYNIISQNMITDTHPGSIVFSAPVAAGSTIIPMSSTEDIVIGSRARLREAAKADTWGYILGVYTNTIELSAPAGIDYTIAGYLSLEHNTDNFISVSGTENTITNNYFDRYTGTPTITDTGTDTKINGNTGILAAGDTHYLAGNLEMWNSTAWVIIGP